MYLLDKLMSDHEAGDGIHLLVLFLCWCFYFYPILSAAYDVSLYPDPYRDIRDQDVKEATASINKITAFLLFIDYIQLVK